MNVAARSESENASIIGLCGQTSPLGGGVMLKIGRRSGGLAVAFDLGLRQSSDHPQIVGQHGPRDMDGLVLETLAEDRVADEAALDDAYTRFRLRAPRLRVAKALRAALVLELGRRLRGHGVEESGAEVLVDGLGVEPAIVTKAALTFACVRWGNTATIRSATPGASRASAGAWSRNSSKWTMTPWGCSQSSKVFPNST